MSTTESSSHYNNLEKMSIREVLTGINREDMTVAGVIEKIIPSIELLVAAAVEKMQAGGRMFYIGAGTSGRLGVVDASEIPPTYGVAQGRVIGIIAGGDKAIRKAVEHAEDDVAQAWKDLTVFDVTTADIVIGIAASGRTPYVIGGIKDAMAHGIVTGCVVCNAGSALAKEVTFPVEAVVGPEFVTGSTRMKSGTAQKFILNMISTAVMIRLGHVRGNKMVDMQLTNNKLIERGVLMIMNELQVPRQTAAALLTKYGNVRDAIANGK